MLDRNYSKLISEADYRKAIDQRREFREFAREQIFVNGQIMVLPGGAPEPTYYATYHGYVTSTLLLNLLNKTTRSPEEKGKNLQGFGFGVNMVYSVLAGLPMIAVPSMTSPILVQYRFLIRFGF